jgi:polysaccharide deacetylase family protein (PEP-CTERM system associated)
MKEMENRNALTVDFEDWYHGLEIPQTEWATFEDRILHSGRLLLDILDEAGTRATFFVLGPVAVRHPQLIRAIARAGHEIATHGCSHALVYRQGPTAFKEDVRHSLNLLEALTARPVLGHRAPFFSITSTSLWALNVLAELGIRYDSSIFPIRNYRYGIEDAIRWPHEVDLPEGKLLEFPISTCRVRGRNVPAAGGAYFRIYPYRVTRRALASVNRAGYPAVFYLHPWELDPGHPRIRLPRRIALPHYFNLGATERRLQRLLRDFSFAPMSEVLGVV